MTAQLLHPARPDLADVKRRVVAEWSARAHAFDEGDSCVSRCEELTDGWRRVFEEVFGPAPKDVLDVGSGTGELAVLFHSMGHRVRGIDLAPGMLAVAQEKMRRLRLPIAIERGDAEAPPFPDESFDVVHARHVVQLLPDPHRALREWLRILRPGGLVFLTASSDDGREPTVLQRVERPVGRAVLRAAHALRLDRRPVLPAKREASYDGHCPLRGSLGPDGLRAFLESEGVMDVHTRDLLALRMRGWREMTWYRRWANPPKRAYHAAWGWKRART